MRPTIHTHMDKRFAPLCVSRSHALRNTYTISNNYEKNRVKLPLLLRIRFSALFSGDHTETPPEVITFFATSGKEFLFRIPTYYRLGAPFNVTGFSGV